MTRTLGSVGVLMLLPGILLGLFGIVQGQGQINSPPTYVVVTPTIIRPNQDVVVAATILQLSLSDTFTVSTVISYVQEGEPPLEISSAEHTFTRPGTHNIILKTPPHMSHGNYTMRVAGFSDPKLEGLIFSNETKLFFDSKQVSVFIFTSKAWYSQKQTVRFRVIPLTTELKPVSTSMDISMMNAAGLVVKEWFSQHTNAGGVLSLAYPLSSHFVGYGTWTIQVKCMGHIYTKKFQVEEYYGPFFWVRVVTPNYMYQSTKALTGKISAEWTNTLDVKGNATMTIEFLHSDDRPVADVKPIIREIPEFDNSRGGAEIAVPTVELANHLGSQNALIGKQVKVSVTMLDWHWNKTYSGFSTTRVFSDEVNLKFLGGRVWTFKPNVPFKIYIAAVKADQSPIQKVVSQFEEKVELQVSVEDEGVPATTRTEYLTVPKSSIVEYWLRPGLTTQRITVVARYGQRVDTEKSLVATRHFSPNDLYIHITTTTPKPSVGTYIIFSLQTNTFVDYVHYHIVSAGRIITSDKVEMFSRNKLLSIALSRAMAPAARIVAYFIGPDGQVAADSLQFHVDASKLHLMKMGIGRGKDLSSSAVKIGVKTRPLSYVGVAITRKEFYQMGHRNSFTWEQVNRELYTYDSHANRSITHYWKKQGQIDSTFRAPTPSFAHDANTTFYYSGLYIFTDANVSSVYTTCNSTKGDYPCMDGNTCYNYKHVCDQANFCSSDHKDEMGCPAPLYPGQVEESEDTPLDDDRNLWRAKHVWPYRTDLAFGWLHKYTKQSGGNAITLKASPIGVTWVLSGFALNPEHGLSIAQPVTEKLHMWIFIKVGGQTKVRLGEILSLEILISNKWSEPVDALLSIPASDDYSFVQIDREDGSLGSPVSGEQQILVPMFEKSKRVIYVPIEPHRTGSMAIPVRLLSVIGGHSATLKITVGHDGIQDRNITNYQVDLRQANSERLPDLFITVEESHIAPEQRLEVYVEGSAKSYVNVIGDIVGISFFPKTNYDLKTTNLIGKPYYSGSEATFNFAANLYSLNMVRSLGTLDKSKLAKITTSLNVEMQEMLSYLQPDGSFLEFRWSFRPSTWLTATALEVLADGTKLTDLRDEFKMPSTVVNLTASWLVQQQDNTTGEFFESGEFHNRMYVSRTNIYVDVTEIPANLALTALCVASLNKAASTTTLGEDALKAIKMGSVFLAQHFKKSVDPLEVALATYALFTTDETSSKQQALSYLKSMSRTNNQMRYWSSQDIAAELIETNGHDTTLRIMPKKGDSVGAYTVAATSFALMAYMENSEPISQLDEIQRFLQEQHLSVGGFYSSHDTLIAMRALTRLADKNQDRATYDMTFTFTSDQDDTFRKVIRLNKDNWFDLQRFQTPSHWGSIRTHVKGHGIALVQLETSKHVADDRDQLKKPPIRGIIDLGDFNTDITTRGFNHSFIDYKLCPRWNGESDQSGMVVLEVTLPNGYKASNWGSQRLVKKKRGTTSLRAAQHLNGLMVFYFDYINKSRSNCAEFTASRKYPVAKIAELTRIKVYEYYEPSNFLLTYYEKIELNKLTVCLVCGSYQCPYCPFYNTAGVHSPYSVYTYLIYSIALIIQYVLYSMVS